MGEDRILLAHGGGGLLTRELILKVILPLMGGAVHGLPDAADVPGADGLVLTTDSFVVKPLVFRGGDIGSLSVYGTINDLAVSGAEPLALSMGLIIEEGLDIQVVRRILTSASDAARNCGIRVVTGDTKVVAQGEADDLFVHTSGIGIKRVKSDPCGLCSGDCVLINGFIAEHGVAVMSERKGIEFGTLICSDSASVWPFVRALIEAKATVHAMRDPTRGGLAACCVELADDSEVTIELEEDALPIRPEVRAACDLLGMDPLSIANEGKIVAFVPEADASRALDAFQSVPGGECSAIIGRVVERRRFSAWLKTRYGGERIIEMPYGEELPRIC